MSRTESGGGKAGYEAFRALLTSYMVGTIWLPYMQSDFARGILFGTALAIVIVGLGTRCVLTAVVGCIALPYVLILRDSFHPFPAAVLAASIASLVWIAMMYAPWWEMLQAWRQRRAGGPHAR